MSVESTASLVDRHGLETTQDDLLKQYLGLLDSYMKAREDLSKSLAEVHYLASNGLDMESLPIISGFLVSSTSEFHEFKPRALCSGLL